MLRPISVPQRKQIPRPSTPLPAFPVRAPRFPGPAVRDDRSTQRNVPDQKDALSNPFELDAPVSFAGSL